MDGWRTTTTKLLLLTALLAPQGASAVEPTVDQTRTAALSHNRLDGKLDRWSARARWSNLLPKVTGEIGWLAQTDDIIAFDEFLARGDGGDVIFDGAHNGDDTKMRDRLVYELQATIDFRGLLFDSNELRAATEERQRLRDRIELIEAVHTAYFARLAAKQQLVEVSADERRALAFTIIRHEATLDALTGGWFRAQLTGGAQ